MIPPQETATEPSTSVIAYRERVIIERIRERPYPADETPYNTERS